MFFCIYFVQMCWFDVFSPTLLQSVQCASANKKQQGQFCKCYQMISWIGVMLCFKVLWQPGSQTHLLQTLQTRPSKMKEKQPLAYFSFWQIFFATFKLQPLLFLLISPSVMQIIWDLLLRLIYLSGFLSPLFRGVFFLHFTVATNKGTSKGPIFCL